MVVEFAQLPLFDVPSLVESPDSNEWYTPKSIIEAARFTMGSIDLDPASCSAAQEIIQASRYYTKEDDGMAQVWSGNIWLNPPYSRGLIDAFVDRVIEEVYVGNVDQAVVLVNNCTETRWFQDLLQYARAVCFPAGRVKFWGPLQEENGAKRGQAIFYLLKNANSFQDSTDAIERFWREFEVFGRVLDLQSPIRIRP